MFNIHKRFALLGEKFYQYVKPSALNNPHLIHINRPLVLQLGLDDISDATWLEIVNATKPINNYKPLSSIYAGHQFGIWVSQLGDGRATLIGEHLAADNKVYELQLKGAGQTPYSRFADGRAVLRSSIREYLCSHAMLCLGIPTTQALAIIGSDTPVYREEVETASIVLRVAPSFIRFGHFELFASRNQIDELEKLTGFVIDNYYPQCKNTKNKYSSLLDMVAKNTAKTIAKWQTVGFCHGVMNSDNMSILGLTLDYGPFGFLDNYNPGHTCNHSDSEGRYAYDNQIQIAWWNIERFATTLTLLTAKEALEEPLNNFASYFNQYYIEEMGKKLGINNFSINDLQILKELLEILAQSHADWTIFWRNLSKISIDNPSPILDYAMNRDGLSQWLPKYLKRRQEQGLSFAKSQELMLKSNPAIVLRNHLAEICINQAKTGNFNELERLFTALSTPYAEHDKFSDFYAYPPQWASHISVSCSS